MTVYIGIDWSQAQHVVCFHTQRDTLASLAYNQMKAHRRCPSE